MTKSLRDSNIFFSLKISLFYLIFGFLFILYFNSTLKLSTESLIYSSVFVLLTTCIFYFLVFFFSSREIKPTAEKNGTMKQLFEKCSFMVVVTNEEGKIDYTNSKFRKISGYSEDLINKKDFMSLHDIPKEAFESMIKGLKAGEEWTGELTALAHDAKKYFEIASIIPIYNKEKKANEFIKISTDISGLRNDFSALSREKEKVEILNNAKTQFLSNMSQEIRTPMSGIIGMAELLLLTSLTKEQKEYLDIINFSSSTLLAIINDILDFSRIETGKLKLESLEFDIRELIQKTAQILDFDARRKKLSLKLDINDKVNYKVLGDPLRLNQILINLLKNSVKYTEKGHIDLKLKELSRENKKVWLQFVVSDTGVGFDDEKLKSLLENVNIKDGSVFAAEFEYKGTGLGLAIVKHLIGLMNGRLKVDSEIEKGTTFVVEIPFDLVEVHVREVKPEVKPVKAEEKTGDNAAINILVAEDNIVNQRLVKELLVRKKYNVTIVENGLKIFDVLEHTNFNIILMDIQMPIMDGLEATAIIREIEKGSGKHTPIIGITAYSVKADREKCLQVGMDDYLAKPFVKEDFYKMIEKYVTTPGQKTGTDG